MFYNEILKSSEDKGHLSVQQHGPSQGNYVEKRVKHTLDFV